MSGPKTELIQIRMVSINGGYSYKSPISLSPADLEKFWPELSAKMDPALRTQVQTELPKAEKRELLIRYLQLSPSHLVVG